MAWTDGPCACLAATHSLLSLELLGCIIVIVVVVIVIVVVVVVEREVSHSVKFLECLFFFCGCWWDAE